ncbi:hypothetical protein G7Y31_04235 [Corynebacterium lizhenjunii]|uniref:Uncharacterized protein n=1 Tax=Corynebacterium lizhenjunii TaxID=2709394 RepID=A0A7T0KHD4_9CORY|nr:hypothetical protein [Corynebacterium lizhenjunii]QPK79909.1 hypothetical protein G7Y31_04235 [Corynebacterium lizhenjunii]
MYPLHHTHCGTTHLVAVDAVYSAAALSIPHLLVEPVTVPVTLSRNTFGSWGVRAADTLLGTLDVTLERVESLTLSTLATVEITDGWLDVSVHMGLPCWNIPRNDAPLPVLSPGVGYPVDTSVVDTDIHALGTCAFFSTLQRVGETTLLTLDDTPLGAISIPHQLPEEPVCVWTYSHAGRLAVDIGSGIQPAPPALGNAEILHAPNWHVLADAPSPAPHGPRPFAPLPQPAFPIDAVPALPVGYTSQPTLPVGYIPQPSPGRYSSESQRVAARRQGRTRHRKN